MEKRILNLITATAICLALSACSDASKTAAPDAKAAAAAAPKEAAKPAEAIAAKSAFFEMYKPARQWATDLLVLSVTSGEVPGIKNEDGKAGMWTVVFVSPSKREARTFFYSVVDSGTEFHKGVSAGGSMPWSGATPKSKPFSVSEFSVNSDAAYTAAAEKAGAWLKKNPGKKCAIFLGSEARFTGGPVWYFMWGDKKSGYLGFVSASTGQPLA